MVVRIILNLILSIIFIPVDGTENIKDEDNEAVGDHEANAESFVCQKRSTVISNQHIESHNDKIISTNSSEARFQRTQSENTPLFHDSSSGRLVKLDNFSFDSAPNHFEVLSKDNLKLHENENSEVRHDLKAVDDLHLGKLVKPTYVF